MKGKIIEWNDAKGYGFSVDDDTKLKAFVHISQVTKSYRRPQVGDKVRYDLEKDDRGRLNAKNVAIISRRLPGNIAFVILCTFVSVASIVLFDGRLWLLLWYLLLSVITYTIYAIDKKSAQRSGRRISENTLLLWGLLGGWPGALFAQSILRHKSVKQPFKALLWVTIVLNIAVFSWTFSPDGIHSLEHIERVVERLVR